MEKTSTARQEPTVPESVHETADYRVIVAKLSGPETTPGELRVRYIITEKQYPIIAGYSGLRGEAINMCLQAQELWDKCEEALAGTAAAAAKGPPGMPAFPGFKLPGA